MSIYSKAVLIIICITFVRQLQARMNLTHVINSNFISEYLGEIPLGNLYEDTTIQIKITNWNQTPMQEMFVIFGVSIPGTNILLQPCSAGLTVCTVSFYIAFMGPYYFQPYTFTSFVQSYKATVTSYMGGNKIGGTVIKQVAYAVSGPAIIKDFYIASSSPSTVYFSVSPFITEDIKIYSLNPSSSFAFSAIDQPISHPTLSFSYDPANPPSTGSYNATLSRGYYRLIMSGTFPSSDVTLSWQTDPFVCLYGSIFEGYYEIEKGCTQPINDYQFLPCLAYKIEQFLANWNTTQNSTQATNSSWETKEVCALCIYGYILVDGQCNVNTTCPARQYFHFGKCYPVDPQCGSYDQFTGGCLSCASPNTHFLINFTCLERRVECTSRQWVSNATCFNISQSCGQFDKETGKCLTCLNTSFQLLNGQCIPFEKICSEREYLKDRNCLLIPSECIKFDKQSEKCLQCIIGYYSKQGICMRILCPQGKVPKRQMNECKDVSPFCKEYDPVSGACFSCKYVDYSVSNDGECRQIVSPLAGCREREKLGFGACLNPQQNCRSYNLKTRNCDECQSGYFLNFEGKCQLVLPCQSNQSSVNGQCLKLPDNCIKTGELGLCTQCVNINYLLAHGICYLRNLCGPRQYLNLNNLCLQVSPLCGQFNPSNGQCITCIELNTQPHMGVCCLIGQIYNNGKCITESSISRTLGQCQLFHPFLGYCLVCSPGFQIEPVLRKSCISE